MTPTRIRRRWWETPKGLARIRAAVEGFVLETGVRPNRICVNKSERPRGEPVLPSLGLKILVAKVQRGQFSLRAPVTPSRHLRAHLQYSRRR